MKDVVQMLPRVDEKLNVQQIIKIINWDKNWSCPGLDGITNFWWNKATIKLKNKAISFLATAQLEENQFPLWFSEGKTALIS